MKNTMAMPKTYWQRISSLRVAKEKDGEIVGEFLEFASQGAAYNAQIVACQHGCKVAVRRFEKPDGSAAWALWLIQRNTKKTTHKKTIVKTETTTEGAK